MHQTHVFIDTSKVLYSSWALIIDECLRCWETQICALTANQMSIRNRASYFTHERLPLHSKNRDEVVLIFQRRTSRYSNKKIRQTEDADHGLLSQLRINSDWSRSHRRSRSLQRRIFGDVSVYPPSYHHGRIACLFNSTLLGLYWAPTRTATALSIY